MITPQITVKGAARAAAFYRDAFGALEVYRNLAPDGVSIIHLELMVADWRFFVMDEMPAFAAKFPSPQTLGGTSVTLHFYVDDVDAAFQRAVDAGATVIVPVGDQFWGERYGMLLDPFGHRWSLASRIEDPSPDEVKKRAEKIFKPQAT